jgi:hypothetical protein
MISYTPKSVSSRKGLGKSNYFAKGDNEIEQHTMIDSIELKHKLHKNQSYEFGLKSSMEDKLSFKKSTNKIVESL